MVFTFQEFHELKKLNISEILFLMGNLSLLFWGCCDLTDCCCSTQMHTHLRHSRLVATLHLCPQNRNRVWWRCKRVSVTQYICHIGGALTNQCWSLTTECVRELVQWAFWSSNVFQMQAVWFLFSFLDFNIKEIVLTAMLRMKYCTGHMTGSVSGNIWSF